MLNFQALGDAIVEAAVKALGQGAQLVEARAKRHAPVRSIFTGSGSSIRPKSASEMQRSIAHVGRDVFAGYNLGERATFAGTTGGHPPAVNWRGRRLAAAGEALESYAEGDRSTLSRRGAYEVKQALAHPKPGSTSPGGRTSPSFATFQHLNVGGRLRGEIYSTEPSLGGDRAEAWVISPTSYAGYQEFGTRHNAAHPFLRPAAEESQGDVNSLIAAAVKEASRTGTSTEIEIVVRL